MRRILLLVLVSSLLFATPALAENGAQTTTLLSPTGQPIGGQWQAWMNGSHMPTFQGSMVLDLNWNGQCGATPVALGCTAAGAWTPDDPLTTEPETAIAPGQSVLMQRWVLLYEQGHVVDLRDLTDGERAEFLALWHLPQPPSGESMASYWWQRDSGSTIERADIEMFATDYATCAEYGQWSRRIASNLSNSVFAESSWYPGFLSVLPTTAPRVWSWSVQAQRESCPLIAYWITEAIRR